MKDVLLDVLGFCALVFVLVDEPVLVLMDELVLVFVQILGCVILRALRGLCESLSSNFFSM